MIAAVTAEVDDGKRTEAEARAFYESHRTFFMRPGRLRVRTLFFRAASDAAAVPAAQARAAEAVRRAIG